MAETVGSDGWALVWAQNDLVKQGGLNEKDFEYVITHFKYKGRRVIISHIYNQHLVVSVEGKEDADFTQLMGAFSKVVEYEPFCKYNLHFKEKKVPILPTYEWEKFDVDGRLDELSKKSSIADLVRI